VRASPVFLAVFFASLSSPAFDTVQKICTSVEIPRTGCAVVSIDRLEVFHSCQLWGNNVTPNSTTQEIATACENKIDSEHVRKDILDTALGGSGHGNPGSE